jgi:hypothetical protein
MPDFGTMVARIRTDLNRGSEHDSRIKLAICDAISYYQGSRLGWNTRRAETQIGPGDEFVILPTDWVEVDHLRLDDRGHRQPFDEVGYSWIEDHQRDDTGRGQPCKFAIETRELRIYPIADRTYSLQMTFQYSLEGDRRSDGALHRRGCDRRRHRPTRSCAGADPAAP